MATFIETDDVNIFLDPAVSLAPSRWHLHPHEKEQRKRDQDWHNIRKRVQQSDIAVITHYHYDHYNPRHPEIFSGKKLLIKHPKKKINKSQKGRASAFLESIHDLEGSQQPTEISRIDGKTFEWGDTEMTFSKPMPHGAKKKLGFVTEVFINDGEKKFLYTSDVEGPCRRDQVEFILEHRPEYLIVDGPMTYLLGFRYPKDALNASIKYFQQVLRECPVKQLAIDHHALRKKKWKDPLTEVFNAGGARVMTMAGVAGKELNLLEAHRRELYGKGGAKGPLLRVQGIGEKMKEKLLDHFEDLEAVRDAEVEELTEVKGIGTKTAEQIAEDLPKEMEKEEKK